MLDEAVGEACRAAREVLRRLGAVLVPVDLGDVATAHADGYWLMFAELASLQEPEFYRLDKVDAGTLARIERGRR